MTVSKDTILIKKVEYGLKLSDLLTKKKKKNRKEKFFKKNETIVLTCLTEEDLALTNCVGNRVEKWSLLVLIFASGIRIKYFHI
ncbi:hypothetical protein I2483_19005 [Sporosarcina sp. E16_3]|uniref:hypothetical protein n=1 Tax=Sporosarcina sp. E16_3 TaxID=2789293 RepID=UPI001A92A9D6|nr:hypothetical protein [Sporosarcina sp. E16_3]MBO0603756.1 hypothetical protein [Sporosarcina sp. E16_3]